MIEVPPAGSQEARWLRYGAMTCQEYIFMRSKWAFLASGWTLAIGIWELTIDRPWTWILALVLFLSTAANLWVASRWRYSWRFWHQALGSWLDRQESYQQLQELYRARG